ncbi:nucleotidyltransferase family protein [Bacillota bacterium LX-D]|nr:nucleotidyltransferase family protein [Bacillota bacterium LX-D]
MKVDAIVLAGSPNQGPLKECSPAAHEALIPIGKRLMVDYVVEALKSSSNVNNIIIVGPVELEAYYKGQPGITLVEAGDDAVESLSKGLKRVSTPGHVLAVTSDIPLLTPEAIEAFMQKCAALNADLFYPIIPKKINDQRYPNVMRTYVTLKEGTFTGGNIFLFNPRIMPGSAAIGAELVKLRKSPFALCKQIGIIFIVKFLLKLLTIREVEARFSKLLKLKGRAVIIEYPEIGIDVDKPSDLELVYRALIKEKIC